MSAPASSIGKIADRQSGATVIEYTLLLSLLSIVSLLSVGSVGQAVAETFGHFPTAPTPALVSFSGGTNSVTAGGVPPAKVP